MTGMFAGRPVAIYRLRIGGAFDPAAEDEMAEPHGLRVMAEPHGLRVGDAEREAVAASLREHYAHGRLTLEEFQQRIDAAFAAKTDLDLARITRDLPAIPGPAGPGQPGQSWQRQWQPPRQGPMPRPRIVWPLAMLIWLTILVLMLPVMLLTRGFFPFPLLILFAIFAFGRRFLRRAGRRGPWSGGPWPGPRPRRHRW